MKKPNILMIMTDQHRFDAVSYLNHHLKLTPNLDQVAEDSVVFTNAYTPAPTCGPARASLQTGMYPPGCGVVENLSAVRPGTQFMNERLLAQGYDTGLSGKLHFSPPDKSYGFNYKNLHDAPYSVYGDEDKDSLYIKWLKEEYFNEKGIDPVEIFDEDELAIESNIYQFIMGSGFRTEVEHDTPWTVDGAIDFLEQRDKDKPFFLMTSFFGPHHPYLPPAPWDTLYDPDQIELPANFYADMSNNPVFAAKGAAMSARLKKTFTEEKYKEMIAANYGQITMIDHYIGKLIEYLKENNLYEDTVVIFTSDHGDHLGSYGLFFKTHMYDSCCKMPLFIKPANGKEHMEVKEEVVNSLDLYGTILDLAGDSEWQKEGIESKSLVKLVDGIEEEWDNTTYSIIGNKTETANMMMRKGKYKIIRLQRGKDEPLYELYDLEANEAETINIYETIEADTKNELKQGIDDWAKMQLECYPTEIVSYRKLV
ncbi:MAG: sulfatase-like hydrolase/transferase [Cellulosilyticaceae bacterium]